MTLTEQIQIRVRKLPREKQVEVLDFVAFLQQRIDGTEHTSETDAVRGKRIKSALQKLADLGTFAEIADPVEWQKQIRKDRPLP